MVVIDYRGMRVCPSRCAEDTGGFFPFAAVLALIGIGCLLAGILIITQGCWGLGLALIGLGLIILSGGTAAIGSPTYTVTGPVGFVVLIVGVMVHLLMGC